MSPANKNLREMLDEFEAIVNWFNREDLDVDESIAKFEEGMKLAEAIKDKLQVAENKIEIIKNKFESKGK